jgi:hypothetical protein
VERGCFVFAPTRPRNFDANTSALDLGPTARWGGCAVERGGSALLTREDERGHGAHETEEGSHLICEGRGERDQEIREDVSSALCGVPLKSSKSQKRLTPRPDERNAKRRRPGVMISSAEAASRGGGRVEIVWANSLTHHRQWQPARTPRTSRRKPRRGRPGWKTPFLLSLFFSLLHACVCESLLTGLECGS